MRIVCIGDSMTDRSNDPEDKPFLGLSSTAIPLGFYPKHLAHVLRAEVYSFSALARNHDGQVMPTITDWVRGATEHMEPDLLVMQGGGDDLEPGRANVPIRGVLHEFGQAWRWCERRGVKSLILLIPTSHRSLTDIGGQKRRAVNEALRLDYPGETLEYYHYLHGVSALLDTDGFHPNDAGCLLMAGLIASKLKEMEWLV